MNDLTKKTIMKKIVEELKGIDKSKTSKVFIEIVDQYLSPAFGSMTKRDFEILLFSKLQELGAIPKNPDLYYLLSELKVTRTKAKNLLYESKLRSTNENELDNELKKIIANPIFLKDGDKIAIEIDNPLLIDHLRSKLKSLGHITDTSFSTELVKMTKDAFSALFESLTEEEVSKEIIKKLVDVDAIKDTTFKGVIKAVLGKLGSKVAGDVGGAVSEKFSDFLLPILESNAHNVIDKIASILKS